MNESLAKRPLKSTLMAANVTLLALAALLSVASSADQNPDLVAAISEMQRANYFTFIMLLNMMPPSDQRFRGNVTFLMPNDRMLSKVALGEEDVADLLLLHSIPSPLLFDHLQRIPTGAILPSSKPDYMLKIFNNGRRDFFLNNVKLISPNICTAGSSIRCHGVDGVLLSGANPTIAASNSSATPSASCFSVSNPNPSLLPPSPLPTPPISSFNATPASVHRPRSGSSMSSSGGLSTFGVVVMDFVPLLCTIIHIPLLARDVSFVAWY